MMSRFFVQLFLGNMLILCVVFGAGFYFSFEENRRFIDEWEKHLLAEINEINAFELERDIENRGSPIKSLSEIQDRIDLFCRVFSSRRDTRFTIFDEKGRVLGDSIAPCELWNKPDLSTRPEVLKALEGESCEAIRESPILGVSYRYLATPLQLDDGKVHGVCRLAFSHESRRQNIGALFVRVSLRFFMMFAAAIVLFFLMSRLWSGPLQDITHSSLKIAEGNLDEPITISGPLEMQQLAAAMDRMRKTVTNQLETIRGQRGDFRSIVANLKGAILAMDRDHRVVLANRSAISFFRMEPFFEQKPLRSLVTQQGILDVYDEALRTARDQSTTKEVDLFGQSLTLEIEAFTVSSGEQGLVAAVLVVRDHTELMKANRIKADFVANASHELRTPLATIRAATDNLRTFLLPDRAPTREEPPSDATTRHLIEVLDRNVNRLETMSQDMLDLYNVQSGEIAGLVEPLDAATLEQWADELFHQRARKKGVELSIRIPPFTTPFRIDVKRLYLILQNVLDNAVKFTPEGGRVRLEIVELVEGAASGPRRIMLTCTNSGPGIPTEDLPRIFERFYQANASRTGDSRIRGTGLGMAIVKNAVDRLRGVVYVTSLPDEGTTVVAQLPEARENG